MSSESRQAGVRRSTRDLTGRKYHRLEIRDCPIQVLDHLARELGYAATVENVRPERARNTWFESRQAIHPGAPERLFRVRNAVLDVAMSSAEFLECMPFWDRNGVFAVLSERSPIPFRASDLDEPARYRALDQFGSWVCFVLAGPTTDGTSTIVTPIATIADMVERLLDGG